MANPSKDVKPMPFPGESPTVALAMAAAQQYGLHEEDEKPAKSQPKKRAAAKKKPAKAAAKRTTAKRPAPAKRASKGLTGKAKAAAKRPTKGHRSK